MLVISMFQFDVIRLIAIQCHGKLLDLRHLRLDYVRSTSSTIITPLPVECSAIRGSCISSSGTIAITKALVTEETTAFLDLVRASGGSSWVSGWVDRVMLVVYNV